MTAPLPWNEWERLTALKSYEILDTSPEIAYDRITRLASRLLGAPVGLVSLLDESRQWFKSAVGLEVTQTDRDLAFCGFTILGDSVFCIPNALEDERFRNNGLVVGYPNIRFYAGAPLRNPRGLNLGTLCVLDNQPRQPLSENQREILTDLAAIVVDEMELRIAARALSKANEKLSELAGIDSLTQVPNRLRFEIELGEYLSSAAPESFAVLYLDLDRFKSVNDTQGGHSVGDRLLQFVAKRLSLTLPSNATLARIGGDEFIVLAQRVTKEKATEIADGLCESLNQPVHVENSDFDLGVSIGIAMYPSDGTDATTLVRAADRAMYRAKADGGACYRLAGTASA